MGIVTIMGDSNPKNTQKKKAQQSAKKVSGQKKPVAPSVPASGKKIAASLPSLREVVIGSSRRHCEPSWDYRHSKGKRLCVQKTERLSAILGSIAPDYPSVKKSGVGDQ